MTKTKMGKFQASPLSRYGKAGPPVQHGDIITKAELKELVQREGIRVEQLFTKEQLLADKKLMKAVNDEIELKEYRAKDQAKNKQIEDENFLIPGDDKLTLTEEQKRQQKIDNELIPDGKPGDSDNDLIPD